MRDTGTFLAKITIIQFWWIAIWGLAYMIIETIAGTSKNTEIFIYVIMLLLTFAVIRANPEIIERL